MRGFTYSSSGPRWPALLLATGVLILPMGCGGAKQDQPAVGLAATPSSPAGKTPSGGMSGMAMPSGSPAGAPVASHSVSIQGFAFAPASLIVRAGTTVTWTNRDEEPHTVTATGGPFHSSTLTPGMTFRYTFTKPGRYAYLCTIHPFMRGTVVVTR